MRNTAEGEGGGMVVADGATLSISGSSFEENGENECEDSYKPPLVSRSQSDH